MKIIAILVGKTILLFGKILNRGSSLPGKVALAIDKNILKKLKYPNVKIAVTGSSGKGSTSSLIANTLKDNGYTVTYNEAGSNLAWGITTSFIKNSNIFGKIKTDYLVIEIDERYAKNVFQFLKPNYVVITNLTKDQPPRQYDVDTVYKDVLSSITKETTVITNMDEPYLRNFAKDLERESIYYSLDKNKYSYKNQIFENLNTYYCPYCESLLEYKYYNFETLGNYQCSKCDFKYEKPKIIGEDLDLDNKTIKINNNQILIGGDMLYNAYNTLAAYTLLKTINLAENKICHSLNKFNNVSKKSFTNNSKEFYAMSAKAENCTTFNQTIFKIINDKRTKDIVIGWKEISRRYEDLDGDLLYVIVYVFVYNKSILNFYVCGVDKNNLQKRLILAGIDKNKIIMADNISEIKEQVLKDKVDIVYGILNFDYIDNFENGFKEDK